MSGALGPTKRDRMIAAGKKVSDLEELPDSPEQKGTLALEMALSTVTKKFTSLLELPAEQIDSAEVYKLSNSLSGLIRSGVELARWNLEYKGVINQAREEFTIITRQIFAKHPKLCQQIEQVIASVEFKE